MSSEAVLSMQSSCAGVIQIGSATTAFALVASGWWSMRFDKDTLYINADRHCDHHLAGMTTQLAGCHQPKPKVIRYDVTIHCSSFSAAYRSCKETVQLPMLVLLRLQV